MTPSADAVEYHVVLVMQWRDSEGLHTIPYVDTVYVEPGQTREDVYHSMTKDAPRGAWPLVFTLEPNLLVPKASLEGHRR